MVRGQMSRKRKIPLDKNPVSDYSMVRNRIFTRGGGPMEENRQIMRALATAMNRIDQM